MTNGPEQLSITNVPEINGAVFKTFDMITYRNGAKHVYGIDKFDKKHHVSNTAVVNAYGFEARSTYVDDVNTDGSDNVHRPVFGYGGQTQEAGNVVADLLPSLKPAENDPITPEVAPVALPVAAAIGEAATRGFFGRRIDSMKSGFENFKNNKEQWLRRNLGKAAFALFSASSLTAMVMGTNSTAANALTAPAVQKQAPENIKAGLPSVHTVVHEVAPAVDAETQGRLDALTQEISNIGLQTGQYQEVAANEVYTDAIEADQFSMNHGPDAWTNGNYGRDLKGAQQMGAELAAGVNKFNASDAAVVRQAMAQVGHVPQEIINQIASNTWDNLSVKVISVDSPIYHNMTFNNNGQLAVEALRTSVGKQDKIILISYKNPATGKFEAFASRVDCSGVGQVFESVSVPTPPSPVETAPPVTAAPTPTTPTTLKPTTTTTSTSTSTTTSTTSTSTSTTSPARPSTTTTTASPSTSTTSTSTPTTTPTTTSTPPTTVGPKDNPHPPVSGGPDTTVEHPAPGPDHPTTSITQPPKTEAPSTIPDTLPVTIPPTSQPPRP